MVDPRFSGNCPVPVQWLSKARTTFKGKHRHSDRWRSLKPSSANQAPWTGLTSFKILPQYLSQARESFYHASEGFHSFTSQEAPPDSKASTGRANKKRKDAIDERTLSPKDRVAFIKAKRLELASFFENSVWEFDHAANAGPGRVLKARFILKWAKNPDRPPRAKARLVTQGFNDPDASFAFREWHEGEPSMEYLGAEVESRSDGSLFYHQSKYLAKLHPITIDKSRLANPSAPVTDKERTKLRALIGGLQWAATQSWTS